MEKSKKNEQNRTGRLLLLLLVLTAVLIGVLFYRGVLWFNMPSEDRYPVRGVDVSHYQSKIDWQVLAASEPKLSFAFIKATEGSGTVDECFAANWVGARAAGLYVGAYHFFSFESAGETQADNFIAQVPREPDALPPVIDLEYYKTENLPEKQEVQAHLRTLLDRLAAYYGKTPIIYTTESCLNAYLTDIDRDYILWIRSITQLPKGDLAAQWSLWQYNPRGRLPGYSGGETFIDLNVYRGSLPQFRLEMQLP